MKAMIDAEVGRRELADNLKLGPGGIREVEFLVQALQLIRGGREPVLRQRGLLAALAALGDAGHLSPASVQALAAAYRFLRRLENRVQMLGDQQVHALPEAPLAALRIARGLGHADVAALRVVLDAHRAVVSAEFDALLQARRRRGDGNAFAAYWQALPDGGDAGVLANAGFADAEAFSLFDDDIHAANTLGDPDRVAPRANTSVEIGEATVTITLPPVSWTVLTLA
jgi:glutamate-ammonia-ligase adenylyltransferase